MPAALLPTPVGPRMIIKFLALENNFDQEINGDKSDEEQ
jgi:hypothetical protein